MSSSSMNVEEAVRARYTQAAREKTGDLCCSVEFDPRYLEVIPREILERDYGCGDPSKHVRKGEVLLDLGSGGGKICYIASQIVGPEGHVIGVDMNNEMLALAESHLDEVGSRLGYRNVTFHKGKIQDLALDYRKLESYLETHLVRTVEDLDALEIWKANERRLRPMIASDSVDVIVSNCVLNLVRKEDKARLFEEMHRVLVRGGRAVICDIVCDEDIPAELESDPELWSGCISGAYREDLFIRAFEDAGFYGIRILERPTKPWQVIEGLEFRSLMVEAFKGKEGPCIERNQAVVYKGPWRSVTDDDGHTLHRGQRMAVCDKTYALYNREPYGSEIEPVPPHEEVPLEDAPSFDCTRDTLRNPRETKGQDYKVTSQATPCCEPGTDCG